MDRSKIAMGKLIAHKYLVLTFGKEYKTILASKVGLKVEKNQKSSLIFSNLITLLL